MSEHAEFPPSSISRVIQCPGSWGLCKRYPGVSGPEAAEGDAAHWVAQSYLKLTPAQRAHRPGLGSMAPNNVPVNEEMIEGAELYADTDDESQHVEERLPPSEEFGPDCWGTPDAWSWYPSTMTLRVRDYKFGHRFVDVFKNWQLITYACLIVDSILKLDGSQDQVTKIEFEIVQPRSYHPDGPTRTWTILASDLRPFRNMIKAAIEKAKQDDAPCFTGPECRDCSARAHCGTLQRASMAAIDESGKSTPMELPPAALALELRILTAALERMNARTSGLKEVILATMRNGAFVPGYRLERGLGRQRWKAPVQEVKALGELWGVKLTVDEPITPKRAIKAGVDPTIVASMTETPLGETKLLEDDGSFTRRIFGSSVTNS
jgi:Protein of unknown function (DUF2800)